MSEMAKKVIGIIILMFAIGIVISIVGHLLSMAIRIAITVGIGFAIYYGAKKIKLIK